jgi:uncharacterized protein
MKTTPHDPRRLDLPALCRAGTRLDGRWPLAGFRRLLEGQDEASPPADVTWAAQAQAVPVRGGEPQWWLTLHVKAVVRLQCQRCLSPLDQPLALDRRLRFVAGEDEAAREDETSEDDVLALPARLDLHELVEDELILALPLVPMHGTCPQPLIAAAGDGQPTAPAAEAEAPQRANPFAALAALRKPPRH